jgi:hypothetical protein
MKSITIRLDDSLFDWLAEQARLNHRSKNKQIEHLLELARRMPINNKIEARYTTVESVLTPTERETGNTFTGS